MIFGGTGDKARDGAGPSASALSRDRVAAERKTSGQESRRPPGSTAVTEVTDILEGEARRRPALPIVAPIVVAGQTFFMALTS